MTINTMILQGRSHDTFLLYLRENTVPGPNVVTVAHGSPNNPVSLYKAVPRCNAAKIAWRDWGIAVITWNE